MVDKKQYKKIISFVQKNYFIPFFLITVFIVGVFAIYKLFFAVPTYVYAKVKVGQGIWWAIATRPTTWIASSVRKQDKALDLLGRAQAEVLSVRRYPTWNNNQYDVYVTVKLKVNKNKRNNEYTFNRASLSVGSPIEIQFPNADITGTVIDINEKPFQDRYVEKTILLINQGGYNKDFPYRYEEIKIGDKYSDGENIVFEVLDKDLEKNIWTISNNFNAQVYEREITSIQTILVRAKIKVKEKNGEFFYGEENKVNTNASIPFSTSNFLFENFIIRKIE